MNIRFGCWRCLAKIGFFDGYCPESCRGEADQGQTGAAKLLAQIAAAETQNLNPAGPNQYNPKNSWICNEADIGFAMGITGTEVVESSGKNIEVAVMTKEHGLKQLEEAEIDAIVADIEYLKCMQR